MTADDDATAVELDGAYLVDALVAESYLAYKLHALKRLLQAYGLDGLCLDLHSFGCHLAAILGYHLERVLHAQLIYLVQ